MTVGGMGFIPERLLMMMMMIVIMMILSLSGRASTVLRCNHCTLHGNYRCFMQYSTVIIPAVLSQLARS